MKICVFSFNLMNWIKSGGEAKIQVAICDHIQYPIPCSSPIPPKSPPQTLNHPPSQINLVSEPKFLILFPISETSRKKSKIFLFTKCSVHAALFIMSWKNWLSQLSPAAVHSHFPPIWSPICVLLEVLDAWFKSQRYWEKFAANEQIWLLQACIWCGIVLSEEDQHFRSHFHPDVSPVWAVEILG